MFFFIPGWCHVSSKSHRLSATNYRNFIPSDTANLTRRYSRPSNIDSNTENLNNVSITQNLNVSITHEDLSISQSLMKSYSPVPGYDKKLPGTVYDVNIHHPSMKLVNSPLRSNKAFQAGMYQANMLTSSYLRSNVFLAAGIFEESQPHSQYLRPKIQVGTTRISNSSISGTNLLETDIGHLTIDGISRQLTDISHNPDKVTSEIYETILNSNVKDYRVNTMLNKEPAMFKIDHVSNSQTAKQTGFKKKYLVSKVAQVERKQNVPFRATVNFHLPQITTQNNISTNQSDWDNVSIHPPAFRNENSIPWHQKDPSPLLKPNPSFKNSNNHQRMQINQGNLPTSPPGFVNNNKFQRNLRPILTPIPHFRNNNKFQRQERDLGPLLTPPPSFQNNDVYPSFSNRTPTNVTVIRGRIAELKCAVSNLGTKSVSTIYVM